MCRSMYKYIMFLILRSLPQAPSAARQVRLWTPFVRSWSKPRTDGAVETVTGLPRVDDRLGS